ncbi:hypothetical protein PIROE2DRAFT_4526 [Piromyces sp. E2]|nr:hypothetical protein PIROE2DRAFT_4526 [Piromyces sp. E2]|eukprot:OUM67855.1 hypothetical protein PIROE2DRAFT_4526 [Piromyces sp. E2]
MKIGYECLCRSLYNNAKTPQQMKLLWGALLNKAQNRPDYINSSHVSKAWKELCKDKKYFHICHFEDEIMSKIEESLNRYSKKMKHKQISSSPNNKTTIKTTIANNENTSNNSININTQQDIIYRNPIINNNNNNHQFIPVVNYNTNIIYY